MVHFECRKHHGGGDFFGQSQRIKKIKNQSELDANSFSPFKRGKMHGSKNLVVLDLLLLGQENDVHLFTSLNTKTAKRRQDPITRWVYFKIDFRALLLAKVEAPLSL